VKQTVESATQATRFLTVKVILAPFRDTECEDGRNHHDKYSSVGVLAQILATGVSFQPSDIVGGP
jgi:hypothetical protein